MLRRMLGSTAVATTCLLFARAAMAIVWTPNPAPSGTASAGASGSEGKLLTYRITGQDRDSSTPNGQPTDPVTLAGDGTVDVFPGYSGNPPSGLLVAYAQAAYDPVAGTRSYDVTVRLKMIGANQVAAIDPYTAGDTRLPGDPRMDYMPGNGGALPARVALNQTIIINPNKADMNGKVTDSATGLPIAGANIQHYSTDPGVASPFMSSGYSDYNGDYVLGSVYAGPYEMVCNAAGYNSGSALGTVSAGSAGTVNFSLAP